MDEKNIAQTIGSVYSVTDFGAKGDGMFDNTDAFSSALKTAGDNGGGIVFVPAGSYLFKGHLSIPEAVTLCGVFSAAPSHPSRFFKGMLTDGKHGTVLMPTAGKGTEEGEPFIKINGNATLKGVTVFYPEQTDESEPYKYPWTIAMRGLNASIIDTELLNPYNAIDADDSARHYIARVFGQPLRRGIYFDKIHDIGRIENVHFNPWWSTSEPIRSFMEENGEAFLIGRCDWEYMTNCFAIYYKTGFIFDDFGNGTGNVVLTQCGHDEAPTTVIVNRTQLHSGISFNNCQMMGELFINETNKGPVKFNGCGFWGNLHNRYDKGSEALLNLKGEGHVTVNACHFYGWDVNPDGKGAPCIDVDCESATISSCNFIGNKDLHVRVGERTKKCILLGNKFNGEIKIEKAREDSIEAGFNVSL